MDNDRSDIQTFQDQLDMWGADFTTWPDGAAATAARQRVLRDPAARRAWDEAKRLDGLLGTHLERLDAAARDSAIADRAVAAVSARLPARRREARVWLPRIAASVLAATVLGGAFDWLVLQPTGESQAEIVALESFVYGPGEVEIR